MTIPVVVITHGSSAQALCHSAKMIIGEQEELFALEFLPGENVDSIICKIDELQLSTPTIFLVDFMGGSPFNAAAIYCSRTSNAGDVITGVNIPMLINTLIERDSTPDIVDLTLLAKDSGRQGIILMSMDFHFAKSDTEDL